MVLNSDVRLEVNWRSLADGLAAVLANGFAAAFGLPASPASAFGGLVKAFTAIEAKVEPGERAWRLIVLCLAWAVNELRSGEGLPPTAAKQLSTLIVDAAKEQLSQERYILPTDALTRPARIPFYMAVRDALVAQKEKYRIGVTEPDDRLRSRLDSAFTIAIFEVWARKSDTFSSIATALDARVSSGAKFEVEWEAYRQALIYAFEVKPVFGQEDKKISLAQLYVPLRAEWYEQKDDEAIEDGPKAASEGKRHVADLESELELWLKSGSEDYLRVLGGGPGSGKSTSLRALASRLARQSEWRPLFVPLQHIDISTDLRSSIDRFFTHRTNGPFTKSPISREAVETGPPLVLIFDGLDELATPGDAAKDVANLFVSKLAQLTSEIRGDEDHQLKVIVSGRIPSFQAVRRYLSAPGKRSLEVLGFAPIDARPGKSTARQDRDQRPLWWEQYASLTGEQIDLPPAFADPRLTEITNEPLLCYLLVLSKFALENWEAAAENQNRIYERLIDEVWRRGWGEGADPVRRQGAGKNLSRTKFNTLMETVAHAAWLGGDTRSCSEEGFLDAVKINRCEEAWAQFKEDSGPDVTNLAMNFYLKTSEQSHRGFEFTHKSFGDYLAARALVNQSNIISKLAETRLDIAIQDWFAAASTGVITREIIIFIRDECRLRTAVEKSVSESMRIKVAFSRLAGEVLRTGFPLIAVQESSYRGLETRQRNAEAALWAVLSGSAYGIIEGNDASDPRVDVSWPDQDELAKLIDRLSTGAGHDSPVLACFNCIVAPGQALYGKSLPNANFMLADLRGARFTLSVAINANFSGANLEEASFLRASLDSSDFTDALVEGADFSDAHIGGSSLIQASKGKYIASDLSIASQGRLSMAKYHNPTDVELARIDFKSYLHDDVREFGDRFRSISEYILSNMKH